MADNKIKKPAGQTATEFEHKVAQELYNIEIGGSAIKADLKDLKITAAKQIEFGGRKAIIIFVPFPMLKSFRKIHKALVDELEKKFSLHVVLVGQRTVLSKTYARNRRSNGVRPHSRTLTAVQEAILDDVVYPCEIVGKRTRVRTDGSKLMKVHLSEKSKSEAESKLDTFSAVYKQLSNKDVVFEFH